MIVSRRHFLGVVLCAAALRPLRVCAEMPASLPAWFDAWGAVLRAHVDSRGRVDFSGIVREPEPLYAVVRFVNAISPDNRPDLFPTLAHRIAYDIDSYNALAMFGIVRAGIPERFGLLGRARFFRFSSYQIGGRGISLEGDENDKIRPLGEERVHFALNCMVRGCPRLPREPFRPEQLERQLAAAAREFCDDGRNVRPDPATRSLWLSSIFSFYTNDFVPAKAETLAAYVNHWRSQPPVPEDYTVRFLDYDWTINIQPGAQSS